MKANFTPFYIMANVRRLLSKAHNRRLPNWVLACEVFAIGSTSAFRVCMEADIDPEAYEVKKVAAAKQEPSP